MNTVLCPPPDDIPKPDGLSKWMNRPAAPKTGWAIRIGFDAAGKPITLFDDDVVPPNVIRRLLTWLMTGQKWIRTTSGAN